MSYGFGPQNTQSPFLPPEFQIPEDIEEMAEVIAQRERITATILNVKTIGQFEKRELLSGEQWFSTSTSTFRNSRYGFRKSYDMLELNSGDPLPATGAFLSFAHNLPVDSITVPLRIFGCGLAAGTVAVPPNFMPIPYASATATSVIELYFDQTNINIRIGTDWGALNQCYVTIEYLKQI